jgi:hypothetical protein
MFLEITSYYALPGQTSAVLAQRRAATALRVQLGLPPGEIFTKVEGDGPDVRWECRFENRAAYERDLAARAASPAFGEARAAMHTLLQRFERHLQQREEN